MIVENNLSFIDEDLSEVSNLSNKDLRYFESWSCLDVKNWIECLHFLSFTLNNVPNILFNNEIDGFCFLELEKVTIYLIQYTFSYIKNRNYSYIKFIE